MPHTTPAVRLVLSHPFSLGWLALIFLASCRGQTDSTDGAAVDGGGPAVVRTEVDRGPVTVTVEVAPSPARLSDEPTLTLTIAADVGIRVEKPPFGNGIGDFLILGFREPLPEVRDNREVIRQIYTLEATRTGRLLIDPISVQFFDERPQGDGQPHRIETEALEVTIESVVEAEMASLDDLQAMTEPMALESPGVPHAVWWVAAAGMAIAAGVAAWYFRRSGGPSERVPTPYEVAMQELSQLEKTDLAQIKHFYVELTGIVRRYIERTSAVHAAEQTTEEFLREISTSDQFEREQRGRLKQFLESADLVKFAAHQPTDGDVEESLTRARDFIRPPAEEVVT